MKMMMVTLKKNLLMKMKMMYNDLQKDLSAHLKTAKRNSTAKTASNPTCTFIMIHILLGVQSVIVEKASVKDKTLIFIPEFIAISDHSTVKYAIKGFTQRVT